jgi:hypothetical protein
VYDHDPDDVAVLGWEEFTLQQWESIFFGYRSWAGLRTLGRRWSDLIEAGLGCSQEVADRLVNAAVSHQRLERSMDGGGRQGHCVRNDRRAGYLRRCRFAMEEHLLPS